MGNKIDPYLYRLGITNNWVSRWFPKRKSAKFNLEEDAVIRKVVHKKIGLAGIVRIEIERGSNNSYKVFIKAAKPGIIIGRGGKGIEDLSTAISAALRKVFAKRKAEAKNFAISVNVEELKRTEVASQYVAQNVAWDLEKRLRFRRVLKRAIENVMQNRDVQGVKIRVSGRLDGGEIARTEWLAKGKMPLQTLRSHIDYAEATAFNTYGTVGIKVWIYKGERFDREK